MPSIFYSSGITRKNNTGDLFIDQITTMISFLSVGDNLISHELYNKTNLGEQNYFQLQYIYSLINNINNNNYTSSFSVNENLVTSIYNIPYKALLEEKIATFIVFYDVEKQLLNYEIPRELSNNSINQAIVNIIINSDLYYLWIPLVFIENNSEPIYTIMDFKLTSYKRVTQKPLKENTFAVTDYSYSATSEPPCSGIDPIFIECIDNSSSCPPGTINYTDDCPNSCPPCNIVCVTPCSI